MYNAPKQRKRQFRRDSVNVRIFGTTSSKRNRKSKRKNCQNWSRGFLLKVARAAYRRAVENNEMPGAFNKAGEVVIPAE